MNSSFELSRRTTVLLRKRLFGEMIRMYELYHTITLVNPDLIVVKEPVLERHIDKPVIFIHIKTELAVGMQFTLSLPGNYPFASPSFWINNHYYETMYILLHRPDIKELIHQLYPVNNDICMCCNNILCNWSPGMTMISIMDEFYMIRRRLMIVLQLLYTQKFLGILYPVFDSKCIILEISKYL